jgi:hypothetical protein
VSTGSKLHNFQEPSLMRDTPGPDDGSYLIPETLVVFKEITNVMAREYFVIFLPDGECPVICKGSTSCKLEGYGTVLQGM